MRIDNDPVSVIVEAVKWELWDERSEGVIPPESVIVAALRRKAKLAKRAARDLGRDDWQSIGDRIEERANAMEAGWV